MESSQPITAKDVKKIQEEVKELVDQAKALVDSTTQDLKDMGPYLDRI